jgi:hypothetical protein
LLNLLEVTLEDERPGSQVTHSPLDEALSRSLLFPFSFVYSECVENNDRQTRTILGLFLHVETNRHADMALFDRENKNPPGAKAVDY